MLPSSVRQTVGAVLVVVGTTAAAAQTPGGYGPPVTLAQAKQAAEVDQIKAIKAGTVDRSWVDAALKRLGCAIES